MWKLHLRVYGGAEDKLVTQITVNIISTVKALNSSDSHGQVRADFCTGIKAKS